MAGDWIKMRIGLPRDPHVTAMVRLLSASRADSMSASRADSMSASLSTPCPNVYSVIGALHTVWSLFDEQSTDGQLKFFTPVDLDQLLQWNGFSAAMIAVGWLEFTNQVLIMHNFSAHNGASARRRALDSIRKQNVRKMSALDADTMSASSPQNVRTREVEKREDLKREDSSLFEDLNGQNRGSLKFSKPTIEEVRTYIASNGGKIDAEAFWHFYETKGWKVGNQPMKNWKSAIVTWEKRDRKQNRPSQVLNSDALEKHRKAKERLGR